MVLGVKSAEEVFEQIRRAVRTLKRLPSAHPGTGHSSWPEFIQDYHAYYDPNHPEMNVTPPPMRVLPNPHQITELDEVIVWIAWLAQYGEEYPKVVWARAARMSWRRIGGLVGLKKDTCRERFRVGIFSLVYALQEGRIGKA